MVQSLKRYLALNRLIEGLSHFSGFNPFESVQKYDRHRIIHLFMIAIAFFGTFYSMSQADTGIEIVKRSMGLGIFLQTFLKCYLLINQANTYQKLISQIKEFYRCKDKRTQEVMMEKVSLCEKIFKVITVVNSSAVLIFISYPLLKILLSNQFIMMFPFYFPFLDPHSYLGYFATYLLHSILILYTLLFHNAFDIAFVCFTVHAVAMVDLIKIKYDDLSEFVGKCKKENDLDMKHVRQEMKGIIETQREFEIYVDTINKLYKWPCFVTSATSTYSICIALVLILIVKWPLAYGLCWALLGQLFVAYLNGEVINFQYGRLSKFIYEFPWHQLRVSEQKMVILMIHKAARPKLMNPPFTGPLNLERFSTICNAIYSYYNICESLLKA